MKRTFWIIVALSLILAACGGQMSDGTAILPLEEMDGGVEGPNVLENTGTSVVIQFTTGLARECELCIATLDAFVSILGAEAGNLALKVLATGGVYLGGGIPPRILPTLEQGRFMETFRRKGRFSDLLARVPVHVILNPKVALLGAACHGLENSP